MREMRKMVAFFGTTILSTILVFVILTILMDKNVDVGWRVFAYCVAFMQCCVFGIFVAMKVDIETEREEKNGETAKLLFDQAMEKLEEECNRNEQKMLDLRLSVREWSRKILSEIEKNKNENGKND